MTVHQSLIQWLQFCPCEIATFFAEQKVFISTVRLYNLTAERNADGLGFSVLPSTQAMGMEFMYFNEVVVQFFQLCIMKEKVETFSLRFSLLPYEQIRTIEYFLISQPDYLGLNLST